MHNGLLLLVQSKALIFKWAASNISIIEHFGTDFNNQISSSDKNRSMYTSVADDLMYCKTKQIINF